MSTRWYPLYQRGNPQLRVFLPNFWLKLVAPKHEQPPNIVQFHCSMEMTRFDVQNYLEKIYNIKPVGVRMRIAQGKFRRNVKNYIVKDDDMKIAYVVLHKDEQFTFPELFKEDEPKSDEETLTQLEKTCPPIDKPNHAPGIATWFKTH